MIYILHHDQATINALIQTLKIALPAYGWTGGAIPPTGNDTYVWEMGGKPVRLKALAAQIEHGLRRLERPSGFTIHTATVDVHARIFTDRDTAPVTLTEKEIDVLLYLWQRKTPATREDLLKDVWGYASDADTHTIETHIYRLRQKIEPDSDHPVFLTTTKDGYQLAASTSV